VTLLVAGITAILAPRLRELRLDNVGGTSEAIEVAEDVVEASEERAERL
jgi:hypothetical protein